MGFGMLYRVARDRLGLLVGVIVAVVAGGGGSSSSTTKTQPGGGTDAKSTFAGVPQRGDTLGKTSAPVTYVRTGGNKIVYRGIVVSGDNSLVGLAAASAAGKEDKLWQMVEALYERQGAENSGWITLPLVRAAAKEIDLSPAKVVAAMRSSAVTTAIRQSVNEAQSLGINGTPTFAVQNQVGTLQQLRVSGLEPCDFTPALGQALR